MWAVFSLARSPMHSRLTAPTACRQHEQNNNPQDGARRGLARAPHRRRGLLRPEGPRARRAARGRAHARRRGDHARARGAVVMMGRRQAGRKEGRRRGESRDSCCLTAGRSVERKFDARARAGNRRDFFAPRFCKPGLRGLMHHSVIGERSTDCQTYAHIWAVCHSTRSSRCAKFRELALSEAIFNIQPRPSSAIVSIMSSPLYNMLSQSNSNTTEPQSCRSSCTVGVFAWSSASSLARPTSPI